jgi:hypothetical protein
MKKKIFPLTVTLLFFSVAPFFAAAQTTEELIETGRFGAAEPAGGDAGGRDAVYKNRWLFLGGRLGPSLRIYTPQGDTAFTGGDTYGPSLDAGFHANLQILPFFSLQAEIIFTWDKASVWFYSLNPSKIDVDSHTRQFTGFSLQFPVMAKLNFYPGKFRVSPFLGAYVITPLGRMTVTTAAGKESLSYFLTPPLGILGGLSAAFPAGPGIFFLDLRYAVDLAEPELKEGRGLATYRGHKAVVSAGYEFAFFKKRHTGSAK